MPTLDQPRSGFNVSLELEDFPCGGCSYRTLAHQNWKDVFPLGDLHRTEALETTHLTDTLTDPVQKNMGSEMMILTARKDVGPVSVDSTVSDALEGAYDETTGLSVVVNSKTKAWVVREVMDTEREERTAGDEHEEPVGERTGRDEPKEPGGERTGGDDKKEPVGERTGAQEHEQPVGERTGGDERVEPVGERTGGEEQTRIEGVRPERKKLKMCLVSVHVVEKKPWMRAYGDLILPEILGTSLDTQVAHTNVDTGRI